MYMVIYTSPMKAAGLVGNETTARILALLSSIAGDELHTNEIIRRINGNPTGVQRALLKSQANGLITSRRVGNLRLWRMDPQNPLYASMREVFARTRGIPAQLAKVLAKMPGVRLAFLFGSYVTAQDNPTSDIDLFVIGSPDWLQLSEAVRAAGHQLGRVVNPIVWSESELANPPAANRVFLDSILSEPMMWLVGNREALDKIRSDVGTDLAERGRAGGRVSRGRHGATPKGKEPRGNRQGSRRQ
jgi:predicted nucleotidyltransferase